MRRLRILIVLCQIALCAAAPLSAAEYSQQDIAACTPDAWRVCSHAIPDADRVRACLFANQPSLSTPCFNVIERARATRATSGQGGQSAPRLRYY